ncbi:lipopolysaccharide biosynthesis protein [Blautia obeum]|uniref:lipopolysaccharide biosynthesis protein n=1 Tax=Blautia obeum TaxID=40520 RepID=UPI003CFD8696
MRDLNERPSERSIYIWNITGSIANALLSVVALMIVTRMLDDRQADIFSIAWTISQLMATIGTFQIRMYQATDVEGVFCFRQYFWFRIITVVTMMISSCGYILVRGYYGEKALVVLFVCAFRAIDSLADVYEGWFQQKERLDLSGKALTYRIVVAFIGFGVCLFFTKNLVAATMVLIISYIICFFFYDVRYIRSVKALREERSLSKGMLWVIRMLKEGTPLFINAFLMMSIMNEPKMVLDTAIEQGNLGQGVQTIFNILFMPASFLNLAYIVFRPLITKMAIMWNTNRPKDFLKILIKIFGCLFGIAVFLFGGSALLGIPVLEIVYAVNLKDYKRHLLVIIIGGCIYTFAAVLDNALVVIRKQNVLVLSYIMTYLYIKIVASIMVKHWGVMGGAVSYFTAMSVFFVVTAILFVILFKRESNKKIKTNVLVETIS